MGGLPYLSSIRAAIPLGLFSADERGHGRLGLLAGLVQANEDAIRRSDPAKPPGAGIILKQGELDRYGVEPRHVAFGVDAPQQGGMGCALQCGLSRAWLHLQKPTFRFTPSRPSKLACLCDFEPARWFQSVQADWKVFQTRLHVLDVGGHKRFGLCCTLWVERC